MSYTPTPKSLSEKWELAGVGAFGRALRWPVPYSPLWGCAERSASRTAKIPHRRPFPIFQADSNPDPLPSEGRGRPASVGDAVMVLEKSGGTTPLGLAGSRTRVPRVASFTRQPWALGRNPFGIGRTNRRERNIRSGSWAVSRSEWNMGLCVNLREHAKGTGVFRCTIFPPGRMPGSTAGKMPATTSQRTLLRQRY